MNTLTRILGMAKMPVPSAKNSAAVCGFVDVWMRGCPVLCCTLSCTMPSTVLFRLLCYTLCCAVPCAVLYPVLCCTLCCAVPVLSCAQYCADQDASAKYKEFGCGVWIPRLYMRMLHASNRVCAHACMHMRMTLHRHLPLGMDRHV